MDKTGQNIITSSSDNVTLSLLRSNDASLTFGSSATVAASSGIATFTDCTIDTPGTYRFRAVSGVIETVSEPFTVSARLSTIDFQAYSDTAYTNIDITLKVDLKNAAGGKFASNKKIYATIDSGTGGFISNTSGSIVDGTATLVVRVDTPGAYDFSAECIPACDGTVTIGTRSVTVEASGTVILQTPVPFFEGLNDIYYEVELSAAPSGDVVVIPTSVDNSLLQVSTPSLTFTTGNYNTPQKVYVFIPHQDDSPTFDVQIDHQVQSSDLSYNGDAAGFKGCQITTSGRFTVPAIASNTNVISIQPTLVLYKQNSGEYTVSLNKQPGSDVVISYSSSTYNAVIVTPTELTFTSGDWAPKKFSVQVSPSAIPGSEEFSITSALTSSGGDYPFSTVYPSNMVTNVFYIDDEPGEFSLTPQNLIMDQMTSQVMQVALSNKYGIPSAHIEVTISSNVAEVTIEPSVIVFEKTDYRSARPITINAKIQSSATQATLTFTASSSDSDWNNKTTSSTVQLTQVCHKGTYSWPNGSDCVTWAGYQRATNGDYPTYCPQGYYKDLTTGDLCTKCPAGKECNDPTQAPTDCADGFFSFEGQVQCTRCPIGKACPAKDGQLIIPCWEGSYAVGGAKECT